MKVRILFSAAAIGLGMIVAAPAQAQECVDDAGSGNVVCGDGTNTAGGAFVTVIGDFATGTGFHSIAVGEGASSTNSDAVAIGTHSSASATSSTALGASAVADGAGSTALGAGSSTGGFANSVALGASSVNTADNQVQVGGRTINGVTAGAISAGSTDAVNGGQINTIVTNQDTRDDGQDTTLGQNSAAIATLQTSDTTQNGQIAALNAESDYISINTVAGTPASATGANAIAIGNSTVADGAGGVALGNGASNGGFANSVALGAGSTNTAADQVNVGGRTIGGVANGVVASDAVNLGQLNAATAGFASSVSAINASLLGLEGDVDLLYAQNRRQDRLIDKANEGVAMALAMESPDVPAGSSFALSGGIGGYQGRHSLATAISAAVGEKATVSAGLGYGLNSGEIGYRAGFQVAF